MSIRVIVMAGALLMAVVAPLRCVLRMAVIAAAGVLMMSEDHALSRDDRRQSLGGQHQCDECNSENADDPRHLPALYARCSAVWLS